MALDALNQLLVKRLLPGVGLADPELLVTYTRTANVAGSDPRRWLLWPDEVYLVRPVVTLAFGRSPQVGDIRIRMRDPESADRAMSRTCGEIAVQPGQGWAVRNASVSGSPLLAGSPAERRTLTGHHGWVPLTSQRQFLTVYAADTVAAEAGKPAPPVEHRIMVINPLGAPVAARATAGPADAAGHDGRVASPEGAGSSATVSPQLEFVSGEERVLAAYCYHELVGLPDGPHGSRDRITRALMRWGDGTRGGEDSAQKSLERATGALRKTLTRHLGSDLSGRDHTAIFVQQALRYARQLEPTLADLHESLPARPADQRTR